jgi:hypothetical protein
VPEAAVGNVAVAELVVDTAAVVDTGAVLVVVGIGLALSCLWDCISNI